MQVWVVGPERTLVGGAEQTKPKHERLPMKTMRSLGKGNSDA